MDANTNAVKVILRTEHKRKGRRAGSLQNDMLNSPAASSCYASFASENYLLKSVVFGSLCAGSGGRQLVCSDGKASTIIH